MLIDHFEEQYRLGIDEMDDTHREFVDLVNRQEKADKAEFIRLFEELVVHTRHHFEAENSRMKESGFPAINEHMGEHQRVLGEMHRFSVRVEQGNILLARAYVIEQLPAWFSLHAQTMDSALAAHIKARQHALQTESSFPGIPL
ncbi:MAG: hemerythrin domain-containing protein [Candidatus Sedimenticola sp. 6PFRAG7]